MPHRWRDPRGWRARPARRDAACSERLLDLVERIAAGYTAEAEPHDLVQRRAVFRVARCTASDRDHKRPGADAHAGGFGRSSDQLCLDSLDALGQVNAPEKRRRDGQSSNGHVSGKGRGPEANRLAGVRIGRREAVAVAVGALLVVAAFVVPHLHLGIVTPLIHATAAAVPRLRRHRADLRMVERPRRLGHRPGDRHRRRGGAVGPGGRAAPAVAGADVGHLGDGVRVGVLAGDDRRLAARLRRHGSPPATNTCARCRPSPTFPKRCAHSPAESLISNRIRGSRTCRAIRRARC